MTAHELVCDVKRTDLDALAARLALQGYDSWWVDQPVEHPVGHDDWDNPINLATHATVHIQLGDPAEAAALSAALSPLVESATGVAIESKDWLRAWRDGREVVELVDGWSIAPPWLVDQAASPERCVIIDPGLAFGAGDHPTTRDSAILLLGTLQPGDRLLDLGAGSGVLSILARRAESGRTVAVEIDPDAAAEILRNMDLNGVSGVEAITGDAGALDGLGQFDVLAVNIGAHAAKRLRESCDRLAAPGGRLILSGLATWSEHDVIEAYAELGWNVIERRESDGEWVSLKLTRAAAKAL